MVDITLLDSFIYIAYGVESAGCIVEHTHTHLFAMNPIKTHATIVNKSHTHTHRQTQTYIYIQEKKIYKNTTQRKDNLI